MRFIQEKDADSEIKKLDIEKQINQLKQDKEKIDKNIEDLQIQIKYISDSAKEDEKK
jgi:hypothetical protein